MNALLGAAQWVVAKALAPVADGVLEAWGASNNLGLNIKSLKMELLLVKATLELADTKQIRGQAMEVLLGKLQDSAHCAEDLLDELDYFRIHDELHGTYDAADHHAKGCLHDVALNARHTAKAVGKLVCLSASSSAASPAGDPSPREAEDARHLVSCCIWTRARQRSCSNSTSPPNANQEVTGCMPKLGKFLLCSSFPHVHDHNSGHSTVCGVTKRATTMLEFNRVDVSERMKHIVETLQHVRTEVTKILQSCDRRTVTDIAQIRPITTGQSIEPKLYGRDHIMNTIIHDITQGKYSREYLTVLPVVGPGGIGKTTLIQHIYKNQQVQNHFQVLIWVCVSLSFNLNKLLEEIKTYIPQVEGEKDGRAEEVIEQRLKSKRFLLVLDDIWEISNEDDWKRLLLPLKTSKEKGSVILLTTRFPAIVKKVKATEPIDLKGLESKEFRKLFLSFVFGVEPFRSDHNFLLETGDRIMEKLKGSPLAAKTVGTLLSKDLNLRHWRRVLESKEWERQTNPNDIMPALKLSYDHLPFHLQQCFSYSALLPEDHRYSATELINLWIGLDILQPSARNQTFKDIGLSNLNDLVMHGFFREEETGDSSYYIMHDLLHDLALQVASHDCISLHRSNVESVELQPLIRHLSIVIDDDDTITHENLKSQLRMLKGRLNIEQLHTLMVFGEMDGSFAEILGDLIVKANALRILHLVNMLSSAESMLHNLSTLIHLRYLCLGTIYYEKEMHLPPTISRFYHLRILDLRSWYGCCDLPKDLSNLAKLRHFYTRSDELHSDIVNVGKLKLLEELKVFRVNKENEGFEPKQLEHLTELRELGIYNLENTHTKEEAAQANLGEKNYLERLALDWHSDWSEDWHSDRSDAKLDVEAAILESLQPHRYLQELCIRGHRGPCCPTWLGENLGVEALESLHLSGVSWEHLPPLGKMGGLVKVILENIATVKEIVIEQSFCGLIRLELVGLVSFEKWVPSQGADHLFPVLQVLIIRECPRLLELPFSNRFVDPNKADQDRNIGWFPKLQELKIENCPELLLVAPIPWTESLSSVKISDVKLLGQFVYESKYSSMGITGKDDLQSLDEVVAFHNMAGLDELLLRECPPLRLNYLLMLTSLKTLTVEGSDVLVGGEDDVEWQHPVEYLAVQDSSYYGGKELTELLTHLPRLSDLSVRECKEITQLAVEVQQTTSATVGVEDDSGAGLLLLPAHLSDTLQELTIWECPELVLVDPTGAAGGGLQALRSLQTLNIYHCPKFLLSLKSSFSCCLFPSSLEYLLLRGVEGMGTLEPLSNLTSLTLLHLNDCGKDLRCNGLRPLLTDGGQLRDLTVTGSPGFFAAWDSNLQDGVGEEQQLQQLRTDDTMGLLVLCSLLSSSLAILELDGTSSEEMERFTKEQEGALHLLASLQALDFSYFNKLQSLPAGLHKLTNLKKLKVYRCPAVRSLPEDGLPKSLQQLDVYWCGNEELRQQCKGLMGTIPIIKH